MRIPSPLAQQHASSREKAGFQISYQEKDSKEVQRKQKIFFDQDYFHYGLPSSWLVITDRRRPFTLMLG